MEIINEELTKEERQFIEDYSTHTYLQLCKKYGVCEQTINKWRKKYNLEKTKGRKALKPGFKPIQE